MLIQCFDFEVGGWRFDGPAFYERDLEARGEHIIHMVVEFPSKWRMFVKTGTYLNVEGRAPEEWRSTAVYFYAPDHADIVLDPFKQPPLSYKQASRLGVRALDCSKDQVVLREMYSLRQTRSIALDGMALPEAQKLLYARSLDYIIYKLERGL